MTSGQPLLAYLADDFTGATDAMERLELAGVSTTLFLEPPTESQLAEAGGPQAIGVASAMRSLPTESIDQVARPVLSSMQALGARYVHYKVCSTFDSSPTVGSIGKVIDVAGEVFDAPFVPVIVGSPTLNRWVAFGNLFASVGTGSENDAHRIDRHPVMAHHPVTPAVEADLRRDLSAQTDKRIGLVDFRTLETGVDAVQQSIDRLGNSNTDVIVFDTLSDEHLATIGLALRAYASGDKPLFVVGSSAVETALAESFAPNAGSSLPSTDAIRGPVLILVGSCSQVTAEQVAASKQAGAIGLCLDHRQLADDRFDQAAFDALSTGRSVVVTTGQADAAAITEELPPGELGSAFARITERSAELLREGLLAIAGGDTSSHTVRRLGAASLTMAAPFAPGAPICRLSAPGRPADGLRLILKGGQVGQGDLLAKLILPQREMA